MKKKNGFTLIELLAVIIVLAIIALIAMPIIFNVIENAKLKSMENSAYGVVDAVRLNYMENLMNSEDGTVPLNGSVTDLTLSGEHPTGGRWEIVNDANAEDGRGIKIENVTFASMQGYVCNSEEVNGKLTGKVICSKQESQEPAEDGIVFEVADGVINENGWANEPFDVTITAPGETGMKVCFSRIGECVPTVLEDDYYMSFDLNGYSINETKCISFAQENGLSLQEATETCNMIEEQLEAGGVDAGTLEFLEEEGLIDYEKIGEAKIITEGVDDGVKKIVFDTQVNTYTFPFSNELFRNFWIEGNNYVCAKTDELEPLCEVYKLDTTTPELTAITSNPIVGLGFNNDTRKFFENSTLGPSVENVICKDSNNNEFTNTQDLAVGTYAVTCSAISNNGLISNDASLTITVEEKEQIRLETDTNSNGVAELGDEVCIEDECFYVLTNDGTNIRMLSKYRIDVSDNTTRKNRLQNIGILATAFSNETIKGITPSSYEGSIVEDLVGDYKTTLEGFGVTISEATLLSYDEVAAAPFNCTSTSGSCDPAYSWLSIAGSAFSYSLWTRSAPYAGPTLWCISSHYLTYYTYSYLQGVRPVIGIPTSSLN